MRGLFGAEQMGTSGFQLRQEALSDLLNQHQAVFRRAAGGVVEGLGSHDAIGRLGQVGGFVHDTRHVASAHAKGGCARGVSGVHVGL